MTAAKVTFRTTGQVLTWWLGRLESNRTISESQRKTMGSLMRRHVIPSLGKLTLKALTRAAVDDGLIWPMQCNGLSPHTVHKALQGLQQALALAARQKRIADNPLASVSWKDFWTGKLGARTAALRGIDVPEVLSLLGKALEHNPVGGMLALMILASGTRIGETCLARWQHISLSERVWVIPAENTKTKVELVVPLTAQMCALLDRYRQLQPAARHGSPWVFAVQGGAVISKTRASALLREMSGRRWRSHDLRKVARTVWAEIGIDYLVGEMMLNHSLGKLADTYIQTSVIDLRRDAMERWHAWLDERGFSAIHCLKTGETASPTNTADA